MKPTDENIAKLYGLTRQTVASYRKHNTPEKRRLYKAMLEYFKLAIG